MFLSFQVQLLVVMITSRTNAVFSCRVQLLVFLITSGSITVLFSYHFGFNCQFSLIILGSIASFLIRLDSIESFFFSFRVQLQIFSYNFRFNCKFFSSVRVQWLVFLIILGSIASFLIISDSITSFCLSFRVQLLSFYHFRLN